MGQAALGKNKLIKSSRYPGEICKEIKDMKYMISIDSHFSTPQLAQICDFQNKWSKDNIPVNSIIPILFSFGLVDITFSQIIFVGTYR